MMTPEDKESVRAGIHGMIREMGTMMREVQARIGALSFPPLPAAASEDANRRDVAILMARAWGEAWCLEQLGAPDSAVRGASHMIGLMFPGDAEVLREALEALREAWLETARTATRT